MNRFGGAGNVNLQFPASCADDIPGTRLESKICEVCGKGMFRAVGSRTRECSRCQATLAKAREPVPASMMGNAPLVS